MELEKLSEEKWKELEQRKISAAIDLGKLIKANPNLSQDEIKSLAFTWARAIGVRVPKNPVKNM